MNCGVLKKKSFGYVEAKIRCNEKSVLGNASHAQQTFLSLSLKVYTLTQRAVTQGGRISPVYVCVSLFLINRSEVKKSVLLFKKIGKVESREEPP